MFDKVEQKGNTSYSEVCWRPSPFFSFCSNLLVCPQLLIPLLNWRQVADELVREVLHCNTGQYQHTLDSFGPILS